MHSMGEITQTPLSAQNRVLVAVCLVQLGILFAMGLHSVPFYNTTPLAQPNTFTPNSNHSSVTVVDDPSVTLIRADRPVTVVTRYYRDTLSPTTNVTEYMTYVENFLSNIPCHLYLYTDKESLVTLQRLRWNNLAKTKFHIGPIPFLERIQQTTGQEENFTTNSTRHEMEKHFSWHEKIHLLLHTAEDNEFDSDFFLWTDLDSFRDMNETKKMSLSLFPDAKSMADVLGTEEIALLRETVSFSDTPGNDTANTTLYSDAIFGGHYNALLKFRLKFYETLSVMLKRGPFSVDEYDVVTKITYDYPTLVSVFNPKPYMSNEDPLMLFVYFLASTVTV